MLNSDDNQLGINSISVNILNRNLALQGAGPIASCLSLDASTRLNRAGGFVATFPANDPRTELIVEKETILDFYVNGVFEFRGIVEATALAIDNTGMRVLTVDGRDMAAELAEAPVGFLSLRGTSLGVSNAPALILAQATTEGGTTWALDVDEGHALTITNTYGQFGGESCLSALIKISDQTGESFRFAPDGSRKVIWMRKDTPSSGVRAIGSAGEAVQVEENDFVCLIQEFRQTRDSFKQITRIYPYGSGTGDGVVSQTLYQTNRAAPAGFSFIRADNVIINDDVEAAIGKPMGKYVHFKEIGPVSGSFNDLLSAANLLFDAALTYLQRHDEASDREAYELTVLKLPASVHVGSTIRVVYADDLYSVDKDLIVLEINKSVDPVASEQIYRLVVAPIAEAQDDDSEEIAGNMESGRIFSAYPQRNGVTYTTNYRFYVGENQTTERGVIEIDFGSEVVTIQQVLLRFRISQLVTPAQTVGGTVINDTTGASSTSTTAAGGGTAETTSGGSAHTHDVPNHQHDIPITHTSVVSGDRQVYVNMGNPQLLRYDGTDEGVKLATTSGSSGATTSASEGAHTHNVTIPDHSHGMEHTHSIEIDVGEALETEFGIFQETAGNTFNIADLEIQINALAWEALDAVSTDIGGGRWEFDITGKIQSPVSLRQLNDNNLVRVRRKAAGATGKTCMIDMAVKVRSVIQSTAFL